MLPTLSICIPTFNRAGFLGATLDSILNQVRPEVEIVIVDGGSTDNTAELVESYARRWSCIRYFRQDVNHGVDRDVDKCVELAQGTYCWLMSSDDLLRPGAMAAVLQACAGRYSLIIVNSEIRDREMAIVLKPSVLGGSQDQVYGTERWNEFFSKTASYLSFIGCVVIERQVWLARVREPYYGTEFIHVGVIFQRPLSGPVLVMATPWISIRYGNFTWGPRSAEISLFRWPELVWSFDGLPEQARKQLCPKEGWRRLLRILYHRGFGRISASNYSQYLSRWKLRLWERLLLNAVLRMPEKILNLIALVFYSLVRRDWATVYLLKTSPACCFRLRGGQTDGTR